ncbi:hypothetical protein [Amycolatopsis sp. SID8362]|uniref:hypothetical protein n=1 Tax=Amycolatopsis sp. SID8362 TaxID=2690346 RepID=UPI001367F56D|nr:hypothetical protein [Amycolatopsis sp. SID8362]NBH04288.1 hypothetical protein [Amycolatopsis sp. SID8362]NED40987.1 hypothetical protein [Amycolatopsis sp. SID8362]
MANSNQQTHLVRAFTDLEPEQLQQIHNNPGIVGEVVAAAVAPAPEPGYGVSITTAVPQLTAEQVQQQARYRPSIEVPSEDDRKERQRRLKESERRRHEVEAARSALVTQQNAWYRKLEELEQEKARLEKSEAPYKHATAAVAKSDTTEGRKRRLEELPTEIAQLTTTWANSRSWSDDDVLEWHSLAHLTKQNKARQDRDLEALKRDPRLQSALQKLGDSLKFTLDAGDKALGLDNLLKDVSDLPGAISDNPFITGGESAVDALNSYQTSQGGDGVNPEYVNDKLQRAGFPQGELLEIVMGCVAVYGDATGHGGRIRSNLPIVLTYGNQAGFNLRVGAVLQFLVGVTAAWMSATSTSNSGGANEAKSRGQMDERDMGKYTGKR